MNEEGKAPNVMIASKVERNGALVETVFDNERSETAFVRGNDTGIDRLGYLDQDGVRYVPVKPSNNLLKHRAVLFPSSVGTYSGLDNLLGDIDRYVSRYVSLPDNARHLAIAYVLLSWVYDVFRELPYLRFRGDYGTGKTRALLVIGSISYKPFFASGASTVSPIFHTLDSFRGTLIFDEADFRFSDEKAELVKIFNNGNVAGFPVLRTQITRDKEFDPRAFAVFGPKIVGMRGHYEDRALESRFLSIDMEPGVEGSVPINLPDDHESEALAIRNNLLAFRMHERRHVHLDESLAEPGLESRMNQIILPLLAAVPDGPYREAIRAYARTQQSRTVSDRGDSPEAHLLTVVKALTAERVGDVLPVSEIAAAFAVAFGTEYERPITNRYIGSVLRRLGLPPYKSHGVFVLSLHKTGRFNALCRRFGVGDAVGTESGNANC